MRRGIFLAGIITVFFISSVAAPWKIIDLDQPYSHDSISELQDSVQLVRVNDTSTTPPNPVTEAEVDSSDYTFNFIYNKSTYSMGYLGKGYWYADFQANSTRGGIEYQLSSPSDEINETEMLTPGNLTVDIVTDFSTRYRAGETLTAEAEVTDEWNDTEESNADVHLYFTNGTWTSSFTQLGYSSGSYTSTVTIPPKSGTEYAVHVNATRSGAPYLNPSGSESKVVETFSIEGRLTRLNTSSLGCNNQSFFTACERGTKTSSAFNVTVSAASSVELDVLGDAKSGGWNHLGTVNFTNNSGIWTGSGLFPDLNTSVYENHLILRYNASRQGAHYYHYRNLTSRAYTIRDKSDPTAFQSDSYRVKLLFGKYFTLTPLNTTRIKKANITVKEPDGDHFTSFGLDDMNYRESTGLFRNDIDIPDDAENGTYSLDVEAENLYGEQQTLGSAFTVKAIQASFNTSGDIDEEYNKTGIHEYNLTITNKATGSVNISWTPSGDIENFTTMADGNNIVLSGKETDDIEVEFNISYVEDYEGEIELSDIGGKYNRTVEVDLKAPSCERRNNSLCFRDQEEEWLNVTADERGSITRTLTLLYLGERNTTERVDSNLTSNITDYLSLDPSSFKINISEEVVALNYSVTEPGNFTGMIKFTGDDTGDILALRTLLEADVEPEEASLKTLDTVDLGTFVQGENISRQIELNNTGDVSIENFTTSSTDFQTSILAVPVAAGETETVTVTFTNLATSSGTFSINGESSLGDVNSTISVTGNMTAGYTDKVESLRQRISDLRSQASTNTMITRLDDLEQSVDRVESLYEQGSTQQADQRYQQISTDLDSLEQQIGSPTTPPDGGEGTGDQNQTEEEPDTEPNQGGGGGIILPLILGLVVLVIIGFVAYTSIIPEEGDPLFDVLGR